MVDCNGASSSCDDASTAISFDSYFKTNRSFELRDRSAVEADPFEPAFVDVSELYSSCGTRPVFDEEARAKHEKRQQFIACMKLKSSYKEYKICLDRGEELPCEVPATPDPVDENISKRRWESLVSKWRAALRQVEKIRCGEDFTSLD